MSFCSNLIQQCFKNFGFKKISIGEYFGEQKAQRLWTIFFYEYFVAILVNFNNNHIIFDIIKK